MALCNTLGVKTNRHREINLVVRAVQETPTRDVIIRRADIDNRGIDLNRILMKFFFPEYCIDKKDLYMSSVLHELKMRLKLKEN